MTWFDLSWVPSYFKHEDLDVRAPGPVVTTADGFRRPGDEIQVTPFIGTFYPVSGDESQKEDQGQHHIGTSSLFSAVDLPVSENDESFTNHDRGPGSAFPGARLYHHDKVYEFVHKEWWASGNYYRYTLRLRGRVPITVLNPGNGGDN